jgi:hypothetical protein
VSDDHGVTEAEWQKHLAANPPLKQLSSGQRKFLGYASLAVIGIGLTIYNYSHEPSSVDTQSTATAPAATVQTQPAPAVAYLSSPLRSVRLAYCGSYMGMTGPLLQGAVDEDKRHDLAIVATSLAGGFLAASALASRSEGSDLEKVIYAGGYQAKVDADLASAPGSTDHGLRDRMRQCMKMAQDDSEVADYVKKNLQELH